MRFFFWREREFGRLEPIAISGRQIYGSEGFSLIELERAGISVERARKHRIQIDQRRQSAIGTNIEQLVRWREAAGL
jgi:ribosomal protein L13E